MNWEKIQYIFQIPISWYKKIHDRVFNAYGTNFIKVKEGYYGGMEIGLDQDELDNYLNQLSVVKSVDGISPDISGNVELCAVTLTGDQTIYGTKTFASNVYLSSQPGMPDANSLALATIGHVNTFYARKSHDHGNLNNDGTITNIGSGIAKDYYIAADSNGDLYKSDVSIILDGVVKSVNDVEPDENGNVTIDVGGGGISAVNGILPDATGNVVLGNIVHSVEGVSPDQNGNVELTSIVKSVNNVFPVNGNVEISSVTMEDVEDYVEEQNFATEDYVTDQLTNYVDTNTLETTLEDYATQTDIEDMVTEVDGILPLNGAIDFNLDANKWMKTDSSGHIGTTNEIPISLSATNHGYLYANNGSLEFKQDEFVTLSTEQTITGKKTILSNDFTIVGQSLLVKDSTPTGTGTSVSKNGITINSPTPFIDFSTPGTAANDTFIMMTAASGDRLGVQSPHGIDLDAPVNQVKLAIQPTDTSTNSLAVATVGYCQTNFGKVKSVNGNAPDSNGNVAITVGTGTVKSVDGHSPDANGNVQLNAIRTINGHTGDSVGNFGGVVTSINGNTPTDGAVTMTIVESVDGVSPDSNGNVALGAVTSVDGLSPDAQGAVSFGLAGGSWVKTDAGGHLTTTNENVVSVPAGTTPQTGTVTVVVDVSWNGTSIVITKNNLNFTNGLLTSVTNATGSSIATVPYT